MIIKRKKLSFSLFFFKKCIIAKVCWKLTCNNTTKSVIKYIVAKAFRKSFSQINTPVNKYMRKSQYFASIKKINNVSILIISYILYHNNYYFIKRDDRRIKTIEIDWITNDENIINVKISFVKIFEILRRRIFVE